MAKRMNGEGMIRQRKDGRFELRILVGHQENGKQKVISFYGKTLDEVREKKKAYDEDVAQGLNVKLNTHLASLRIRGLKGIAKK